MLTMAEFRDPARMLTFQDFEQAQDKPGFVLEAIKHHVASKAYRIACDADLYDRQMNKTINAFVKKIYNLSGCKFPDSTASNNKIACNFFHRLNTQRNMYSLGAGVSFTDAQGNPASDIDDKLGRHFDHDLQSAAYLALIHGVSFGFWNLDRLFVFPFTQFCPFWDEYDGTLKAGARFWRLDNSRPLQIVLYEEDGYTRFSTDGPADTAMQEVEPKRSSSRPCAKRLQTSTQRSSAKRTTRACPSCLCGARSCTRVRSSACARPSTRTTSSEAASRTTSKTAPRSSGSSRTREA